MRPVINRMIEEFFRSLGHYRAPIRGRSSSLSGSSDSGKQVGTEAKAWVQPPHEAKA
jgi:hypothetical protein